MCIIGRSSGYRPGYAKLAYNYCSLGASAAKLAELFEVPPATIDRWLATEPEFAEEVWRGGNEADATVAESLYRLGTGYQQTVERVMRCRGELRTVRYIRHHRPHFRSCRFWLERRRPEDWGPRRKKSAAQAMAELFAEQETHRAAGVEAMHEAFAAEAMPALRATPAGSAEIPKLPENRKSPGKWASDEGSESSRKEPLFPENQPAALPALPSRRALLSRPRGVEGAAERAERAQTRTGGRNRKHLHHRSRSPPVAVNRPFEGAVAASGGL